MLLPGPTARIVFRAWRPDDLALATAIWGDDRVTAFVGGPFTEHQIRDRLATELSNQEAHRIAYWPLVVDGADAGCCGLKRRADKIYELGFYLRVEQWSRGLAVEAARSVIAFAFDVLAADALFAGHHPENLGSGQILEKLGFRYTHDELYAPTGLHHPGYELRDHFFPRATQSSASSL